MLPPLPAGPPLPCRDGCLRMWDLVKGRCTYTVRLEAEAETVAFSEEDGGARYALLCGSLLSLHSVGGAPGALRTLAHPRRALCMAWAPRNRVVSGSEDGSLRLWDAEVRSLLFCCCCCCSFAAAAPPPAACAVRAPMKETPFTHSTLGLTVQC